MTIVGRPPSQVDQNSTEKQLRRRETLIPSSKRNSDRAASLQLAQATPAIKPPVQDFPDSKRSPGRINSPERLNPGPSANDNKPNVQKSEQGRPLVGGSRLLGGSALAGAAIALNKWDESRATGAVQRAGEKLSLDLKTRAGIQAARAYVWGKEISPRHYWSVPFSGEKNEAVAQALKDNELKNPGQLGRAFPGTFNGYIEENLAAKKAIDQVVADALKEPQKHLASANNNEDEKKDVEGSQLTKTETQTQNKPHECEDTSPIGKTIPPRPDQIQSLVDEHSQTNVSPLTTMAATSIIGQTQPQGTRVEIAGQGVEGPDILYIANNGECDKDGKPKVVDSVQVKSVVGRKGFERALYKEFGFSSDSQSRIIAVQVDTNKLKEKDIPIKNWLARFWGARKAESPDTWLAQASQQLGKEVLLVDQNGNTMLRAPLVTLDK